MRHFAWFGTICAIKKRENHPQRSVNLSKIVDWKLEPTTLLKVTLLHGCFSCFRTKSRKTSQMLMEYWQVMLVETYTAIRESLKNKYMKCIINDKQ